MPSIEINKENFNQNEQPIKVKPRGPGKRFFNHEKYKRFSFLKKNNNKGDHIFPSPIQFGFSPLPQSSTNSAKPSSEIYFDADIDSLQAPSVDWHNTYFSHAPRVLTNKVR